MKPDVMTLTSSTPPFHTCTMQQIACINRVETLPQTQPSVGQHLVAPSPQQETPRSEPGASSGVVVSLASRSAILPHMCSYGKYISLLGYFMVASWALSYRGSSDFHSTGRMLWESRFSMAHPPSRRDPRCHRGVRDQIANQFCHVIATRTSLSRFEILELLVPQKPIDCSGPIQPTSSSLSSRIISEHDGSSSAQTLPKVRSQRQCRRGPLEAFRWTWSSALRSLQSSRVRVRLCAICDVRAHPSRGAGDSYCQCSDERGEELDDVGYGEDDAGFRRCVSWRIQPRIEAHRVRA